VFTQAFVTALAIIANVHSSQMIKAETIKDMFSILVEKRT
jgi:hypothetical protein